MLVTVITAVVTTLGTTSCVVDVHPPASLTPVYAN
ncbi:MAG: hypothetical protein MJZ15_04440 [Bacteroidales bacterium]|nr:hypothetical protein [Bacteroidales bacterium]